MKNKSNFLSLGLGLFLASQTSCFEAFSQNRLANDMFNVDVSNDGIIKSFNYKSAKGVVDVSFRKDSYTKGPSIYLNEHNISVNDKSVSAESMSFSGKNDTLSYKLKYHLENNAFVIEATITNLLNAALNNQTITLMPGIDTELEKYPSWNKIFFPTLLRCEKTHFWGYLLNGMGNVLSLASKEPVASWQMDYFLPEHWRGKGGHLIFFYRWDLMHKLPLPGRHPQNLNRLGAKETKKWTFYIIPTENVQDVKATIAKTVNIPMLDSEDYTRTNGEKQNVIVYDSSVKSALLTLPNGKVSKMKVKKIDNGRSSIECLLNSGEGLYTLNVTDKNNYIAQANLSVRQPYSWYMDKARDGAIENPQIACSHLESWLGLHSGILARKYAPDAAKDKYIEDRLKLILSLQWDESTGIPKYMYEMRKVANTAQMVSVLVDAYQSNNNIDYLRKARQLAQIVMTFQYENGDYAKYTAIFYPAKSMMELLLAEKDLRNTPEWSHVYDMHYASVKRAIDFLVARKDNIMTEGQQTYEDGMLACSATQISMFALLQTDSKLRDYYMKEAQYMIDKHRVLEQSIIPDSRMNGASIRFWEAQYDVLETKKWNFINSPHGWSAWHIYGLWYMYLLTKDPEYLLETKNAINSCVQVIDSKTGKLRWAFVVDPYCEVSMLRPTAVKGHGEHYDTVIGEQYVNMIRNYNQPDDSATVVFGKPRSHGWCCDNDVHEIFKCMEEVCLTSAYICERKDGSFITWNCKIKSKGNTIEVTPDDKTVTGVNVNLINQKDIIAHLGNGDKKYTGKGMAWIGNDNSPRLTYTPKPEKPRILRDGYN